MTLHVKNSGSWEEVTEVHYKKDGSWEQVKEVYVKKNGQWETVLYESATQTITALGYGTVDVPAGAFKARVTLEGGNGGKGGHDGNGAGGDGAPGTVITAVIDVDPFTTLSFNIASGGANGGSSGGGQSGTGGTGYAGGGDGGRTGSYGWSGEGGGGGGASSLRAPDNTVLIVAAGGGGGGGSGNQATIGKSGRDAKVLNQVYRADSGADRGKHGTNCQTADGGGGGGGGGGVFGEDTTTDNVYSSTRQFESWGYQYKSYETGIASITSMRVVDQQSASACTLGYSYGFSGSTVWVDKGCRAKFELSGQEEAGAGGAYMGSYDSDGYPGIGGFSYVNPDTIADFSFVEKDDTSNGADGKLTITWLPE